MGRHVGSFIFYNNRPGMSLCGHFDPAIRKRTPYLSSPLRSLRPSVHSSGGVTEARKEREAEDDEVAVGGQWSVVGSSLQKLTKGGLFLVLLNSIHGLYDGIYIGIRHPWVHGQGNEFLVGLFSDRTQSRSCAEPLAIKRMQMYRNIVHIHSDSPLAQRRKDCGTAFGRHADRIEVTPVVSCR